MNSDENINEKNKRKVDNVKLTGIIKELQKVGKNRSYIHERLWSEVYTDCRTLLEGFARKNNYELLKKEDEMEVFFQEMMKIVIEKLDSFRPESANFGTWFCEIAKKRYSNINRKNMRDNSKAKMVPCYQINKEGEEFCIVDRIYACESAEDIIIRREVREELAKKVEELYECQAQVIKLVFYENKKNAEVAEILGCTNKQVSKWRYEAVNQLKKSFGIKSVDRKRDRGEDISENN